MSRDEQSRPLIEGGTGSKNQPPASSDPDTTVPARGRPVVVRLHESEDFTVAVLDSLAAGMPPGRARDVVTSMRTQIVNHEVITRGLADADRRRLDSVWPLVVTDARAARLPRSTGWNYIKLRREARKLGLSDSMSWSYRAADDLSADGLPWFIMRDCLHDAVADRVDDPISHALRTARRHLPRLRRRAEQIADVHRFTPRDD